MLLLLCCCVFAAAEIEPVALGLWVVRVIGYRIELGSEKETERNSRPSFN